jgi:fructokinase
VIVVAGEALVDLLIRPDGAITAAPGGGMYNTARAIARLGQAVAFLGRLSDDGFGRMLRAALVADGVDGSLIEMTAAPTTLAVAELDASGVATYRFHTAGSAAPGLSAAAVEAALALGPRAFCVGSLGLVLEPMAEAIADGVAGADPATFVMVDPNCRPVLIADRGAYLDRLGRVLRRADVVKLSRDDLAYLSPGTDAIPAARQLLGRGPAAILLTDGPAPVAGLTRTFELELPVPRVEVVDTIGAGDALGGAFLARWIERGFGRAELGDETAVRDALGRAVEVAGLTCRRRGADPPRLDELPDGRPPRGR